ncbi:MAG: hypothetical protein OXQ94_02725 [Gemmatimonadota bacterium]|nr:hypothetical protein [Gemmatimonadota bacterium]MDE2870591.1 hypothetical protein [Gemmatimonadota bacterium]
MTWSLTAIQRKEQTTPTEYSTLSDTIHRSRSAKLRPAALRKVCALLVSVSLATVWGCSDATMNPPAEPVEATAAEERLSEVARAIAYAMNSADVRLDVLKAMRASPRVDHSLVEEEDDDDETQGHGESG